ncbi:zinc finger MYM-type protein 1-like [Dysidea avara]|uniref:zinc finger MYM-type protein 1-like n=1 Tax=Dysidea avara TaxID=196820 RepID=UPI0033265186
MPSLTATTSSPSSSSIASPCECQCCTNFNIPYHPSAVDSSKRQQLYSGKEHGKQKSHSRTIQSSWYEAHPWITVCTSEYKVYCATCRAANEQCLLNSIHAKSTFIRQGFNNWKKALEKFREHECSNMHREAVEKLTAKAKGVRIDALCDTQLRKDQEYHRKMFMKLLQAIQYLSRQGLPLRGHREDAESFSGNLYQLLLPQAKDCPEMISWLNRREYISPEIVNEIITLMSKSVLRNILADVSKSLWYSVIVDEATDVSHNEQMSMSLRWTDDNYETHESNVGLVQLPDTKAQTIFSAVKDTLISTCSLSINQCRGQAYDGASNMSGINNGVQALFKAEVEQALYVHCLAHSLNLCLKDVTKTCDMIRDVLNFIYELTQLIKMSPKRLTLFESLRKEVTVNTGELTPHLRMLCPTRWTVRHSSIFSILKNYSTIQSALDEISKGHDEYAAKANGMASKMDNFDTFFGLKLAYLIFSAAEQVSINIQAKDVTVQEAVRGAQLLITHLNSMRNEARFNSFYSEVMRESVNLTAEPTLPRQRKRPRRIDDGASSHIYETPKDRHRRMYFEVAEATAGEVERRFIQKDLGIVNEIESILIEFSNGNTEKSISPDLEMYLKNDFAFENLKTQLSMLPDAIKTSCLGIKRVTNVRTIASVMNESSIYKGML